MWSGWLNDYKAFERYCLDHGWEYGLQVHRINDHGNYEPGNIRFVPASMHMQEHNRKRWNSLSEDKVKEIWKLRAEGIKMEEIARKLGINSGKVSRIFAGKLWKGVSVDPKTAWQAREVNLTVKSPQFDAQKVREILKRHFIDGFSRKKLAVLYKTSACTISHIVAGKRFKEIWQEFQVALPYLQPQPE